MSCLSNSFHSIASSLANSLAYQLVQFKINYLMVVVQSLCLNKVSPPSPLPPPYSNNQLTLCILTMVSLTVNPLGLNNS